MTLPQKKRLANNLRCDYYLPRGIVILKEQDKMTLQNPGSIRTGKEQMIRGGVSLIRETRQS